MPKVGMEPIRKAQLIEATFECIYRYGFAGTTIARVARQAGVSTGIISHYFGGKDGLLESTMRVLLKQLGINAKVSSKSPDNPREHIIAIINSNFAEQQVTPQANTVWLAFWGQALHVPRLISSTESQSWPASFKSQILAETATAGRTRQDSGGWPGCHD